MKEKKKEIKRYTVEDFEYDKKNDRYKCPFFNWKNKRIFVGNPFSGYYVGVKERTGKWTEVWFENLKLGEINPDTLQIQVNMSDCNAWKA